MSNKFTCGLCHGDGCDYCFNTGRLKAPETGVWYSQESWDEYQGHSLQFITHNIDNIVEINGKKYKVDRLEKFTPLS